MTCTTLQTTYGSSPYPEEQLDSAAISKGNQKQAKVSQETSLAVPRGIFNRNKYCFISATIQCIQKPLLEKYAPMRDCIVKEGVEDCVSISILRRATKDPVARDGMITRTKIKAAMARVVGPDM